MVEIDEYTGSLQNELKTARLGDQRRTSRLVEISDRVLQAPAASFPSMSATPGELEAIYRFLGNEAISLGLILAPHFAASAERCRMSKARLVVHDTTEFAFASVHTGLGRLQGGRRGFLAHFSIAVRGDGRRWPLGALGLTTIERPDEPVRRTREQLRAEKDPTKRESYKWRQGVDDAESQIGVARQVIHLMDREGDSYELFDYLINAKVRFIVRSRGDRLCGDPEHERLTMQSLLATTPLVIERDVDVAERRQHRGTHTVRKSNQPRAQRSARLEIRAASTRFTRPASHHGEAPILDVNIVWVREASPPEGEEAIEWFLVTSEPVETAAQIAQTIDDYRERWTIEEYFRSIKTGCAYEKRQLESAHSVRNALGIFAIVAWRLLVLRNLGRLEHDIPAAEILSPTQVTLLRTLVPRLRLGSEPSTREAMLAVAALGGHIANNGPPGWIVLGRGMEKLLLAEQIWSQMRAAEM
jgi:hypothetical protein